MIRKAKNSLLLIIGILLILNGVLNIFDDARVLSYDITSILSGIGFVILSIYLKKTESK